MASSIANGGGGRVIADEVRSNRPSRTRAGRKKAGKLDAAGSERVFAEQTGRADQVRI
jgi:hypothetical protein